MRTENLFRRVVFRGARPTARSRWHVMVVHGDRRSILPTFDDEVPAALARRVTDDLAIDLWRPPRY